VWYTLDCLAAARTGYLHSDHLGSTSLVTDQAGDKVAEQRYEPWGGVRWQDGVMPTDFGYTGQRAEAFGLLDYNARYYSPLLQRFISADSLVPNPGAPQALNRYAYAGNNP
jgi:RHS repeat-associated protein